MAHLKMRLRDHVAGDALEIEGTVTGDAITAGATVTKAYLTVKADEADADPGILQLIITETLTAAGQITNTPNVSAKLLFTLTSANTALFTPGELLFYDIRGLLSNGNPFTAEAGTLIAKAPITKLVEP